MKKILFAVFIVLIGLTLPAQGIYQMWGMTREGGADNVGVIFSTDASGNKFTLRHQFAKDPVTGPYYSTPVLFRGRYYGVTTDGGKYNLGGIFEWNASTNTYTIKIDFDGSNGQLPVGNLAAKGNKLYGVTNAGGAFGGGVIFEWTPQNNTYVKKYDFNETDGFKPFGGLTLCNNLFYGTTSAGTENAGTIFEWNPSSNVYKKRFEFSSDYFDELYGSYPKCSLTFLNGKFYGVANADNIPRDYPSDNRSVIFEWDPKTNLYTEKLIIDGAHTIGSLSLFNGKFYFVAEEYGLLNGPETINEWAPLTNEYNRKYEFNNSNWIAPFGGLILSGNTFYGVSNQGLAGNNIKNAIFEWQPLTNTYLQKIVPDKNQGYKPNGSLAYHKSKLYGNANNFFEFDPSKDEYRKILNLSAMTYGSPVISDGELSGDDIIYGAVKGSRWGDMLIKFYLFSDNNYQKIVSSEPGVTLTGDNAGVTVLNRKVYYTTSWIFSGGQGALGEYDPNRYGGYSEVYQFDGSNGSYCNYSLTAHSGKLYGTMAIGSGGIFEYNPATYSAVIKKTFTAADKFSPAGSLSVYNNKFYILEQNDEFGCIGEWDPLTNIYTRKFLFDGINGKKPQGKLLLNNGKFYGMTTQGGSNDLGVLFEWNPVTNVYLKKLDFNGNNGSHPSDVNDLSLAPAPVASGSAGTCTNFSPVLINKFNNNQWVAITDGKGNAVAEIKANGNNLGLVTASIFINNGPVRKDKNNQFYLDRNITITSQVPPNSPVDIRFYIKETEFSTLKNSVNKTGKELISSVEDLAIYVDNNQCSSKIDALTDTIINTAETWNNDYVFSTSVKTLGSFYFSSRPVCTAPIISNMLISTDTLWPPLHSLRGISVAYKTYGDCKCDPVTRWLTVKSNEPICGTGTADKSPDWVIVDANHVYLRAERSDRGTGRIYTITINAKNTAGAVSTYDFTVAVPLTMPAAKARALAAKDAANGTSIINETMLDCIAVPNPSSNYFTLQILSSSNEKIEMAILDMSGRMIEKQITYQNKIIRIGEKLKPGVYMIQLIQGDLQKTIKLVKQ